MTDENASPVTLLHDAVVNQLSQEIGRLVAEVTTLRLLLERVVAERDSLIRPRLVTTDEDATDGPADSPLA